MTPVLAVAILISIIPVYAVDSSTDALKKRQAYINALEKEARAEKKSSATAENLPEPGAGKSVAGNGTESSEGKSESATLPSAPRAKNRRTSAPDAASTRTKINTTDDGVDTLSFP